MTLYTSPTGSDQFLVIDEATGKTIAIVYTTHSDAKLLSYAPKMLEIVKEHAPHLYAEIVYEQEAP